MDALLLEDLIKLGMSVLVGGLIGAEREYQDKAAGFRTIILITVGSTLFTIFSLRMDPGFTQTRIAANIVTGIGFLGAGAIVREGGRVAGLTTASTIWLSAALGMGIGAGDINFVMASTVVVLIVLLFFPLLERRIDRIRELRTYNIVIATGNLKGYEKVQQAIVACSLKIIEHHQAKTESSITTTWRVLGTPINQERFVDIVMKEKSVREFDY